MKQLFLRVMLVCITTATSVFADSLDNALGADRSRLSADQIAIRSQRLEESMTFSLLRFPEAMRAPARIFGPQIWRSIENAARQHELDPMILAGMIFVESYGDPRAKSPTGPAGIAQLTKASAKELGLATGRKIRVGSKPVTKTRWVGTGKNRRKVVQTVQQPIYNTLDERFVPERAIMAMARRISNRRSWLGGRVDFAIAEYHMGAGRMAGLLSAYFGRTLKVSDVPAEMQQADLSYAELYWTNTPYHRAAVFHALDDLNRVDFSPTYYFRVRQAMRLLETYRQSPDAYSRMASLYRGGFGWDVLPSWQWSFLREPIDVTPAGARSEDSAAARFVSLPEIASVFGVRAAGGALTAERSTIGSALFVAHELKRLQGTRYSGFEITRMLAVEADESDRLHSLGWAFDVPSTGLSTVEQRDLKFILTDLRQAGLLAYIEEGREPAFHVVRHPDHVQRFEQFYLDAMAGNVPVEQRRLVSVLDGLLDWMRSFLDRAQTAV